MNNNAYLAAAADQYIYSRSV